MKHKIKRITNAIKNCKTDTLELNQEMVNDLLDVCESAENTISRMVKIEIATWLDHMSWTDCDRPIWHTRKVCGWFYQLYVNFCEKFDVVSAEYGG